MQTIHLYFKISHHINGQRSHPEPKMINANQILFLLMDYSLKNAKNIKRMNDTIFVNTLVAIKLISYLTFPVEQISLFKQ